MQSSSIRELGRWILEAEPLLKSGLAWYLPSYWYSSAPTERLPSYIRDPRLTYEGIHPVAQPTAVDYLVRDRRAIDPSGAKPTIGQLVRPILQIDLPFIEGVSLNDFSRITINEFNSYKGFRNFLRRSLLDMDEAINAEQSELELTKLGLDIEDQVR